MELVKDNLTNWMDIVADVRSGKIKARDGHKCRECFGSGFREIADPQGSNYRGVVRCNQCRYWEFAGERIRSQT